MIFDKRIDESLWCMMVADRKSETYFFDVLENIPKEMLIKIREILKKKNFNYNCEYYYINNNEFYTFIIDKSSLDIIKGNVNRKCDNNGKLIKEEKKRKYWLSFSLSNNVFNDEICLGYFEMIFGNKYFDVDENYYYYGKSKHGDEYVYYDSPWPKHIPIRKKEIPKDITLDNLPRYRTKKTDLMNN